MQAHIHRLHWHQCNDEVLAVSRYMPTSDAGPQGALVLHGAGSSTKERCRAICECIASHGIETVAPDFSCHGASTCYKPPSIAKRVAEARSVAQAFLGHLQSLYVFGLSMSGQVAVELTRQCSLQIAGICLVNPALYAPEAIATHLGPDFTAVIRTPESWRRSEGPALLGKFQGQVCLVAAERDDVIPGGVLAMIEESVDVVRFQKTVIADAPHGLGTWFNENPAEARAAIERVIRFFESQSIGTQTC
ncbi:alpha/beta hydrolase [Cupriavidus numazuensis]|uniref:Serine aminopeptidase S33 domain-containing protein n=1 Tax=Cupriavidus numazuensis TaxID=221992 RepID=A0ABN7Q0C3_9BURK|nr:alpha/beta fold hydrolase [Cupriavidus numazuensis]CAG2151023.1 hypothetical protein LMG26411_03865 [Cupriavidus numazuensis]